MSKTGILKKIDQVFTTFQSAQYLAETTDYKDLVEKLISYDPEFRSVAFEAASMSLLSSDLKNANNQTKQWKNFYTTHQSQHQTQLLTGYGWALAVHQKKPSDFLDQFDPLVSMRILDGYGYFYGLLRSRSSVQNIQIPDDINEDLLFAFDQGLGRGLWYLSKGDLEKLLSMLEKFPDERKSDLWRGIGIASAYLGGIDATIFYKLNQVAANHNKQFIIGVLVAVHTRTQSNSITEYLQTACHILTDFNVNTAFEFIEDTKKKARNYKEWLAGMAEVI